MSRRDKLLHAVYQAVGANRIRQRWVLPYKEGKATVSVEGLAQSDGVITLSPLPMVPVLIHECLHRAHPEWSERAIEQATTYLYHRMTDDDCRALYEAAAAKIQIMRSPTESE